MPPRQVQHVAFLGSSPENAVQGKRYGNRVLYYLSIDKVNLLQMDKLNNSVDVLQKPTLIGTLNGTSLKY